MVNALVLEVEQRVDARVEYVPQLALREARAGLLASLNRLLQVVLHVLVQQLNFPKA